LFSQRTDLLCQGLRQLRNAADARPGIVHEADARRLSLDDATVHGIVTSPPYAGTYEYADHQQLRLDFLGIAGDRFRAAEMGARSHFQGDDGARKRRARRRYLRALSSAVTEMARVCRPRALIAVMLGDSVAGDRAMWAEEVMARAVPEGSLEILAWAGQARPKLGKRERDAFGERPKREYIFVLHRG
jgi:DNA modification methylase